MTSYKAAMVARMSTKELLAHFDDCIKNLNESPVVVKTDVIYVRKLVDIVNRKLAQSAGFRDLQIQLVCSDEHHYDWNIKHIGQ